MDEAIQHLRELYARIQSETWVVPEMQRAIMSGIRMSIQHLENLPQVPKPLTEPND